MTDAQDLPWTEDEDEWRGQSSDYRVDPGHDGDWMPTREAIERLRGNDAPILAMLRGRLLEARAHAVMFGTVGDPGPSGRYHTTVLDTIVPDAFWQQCCEPEASRLDWNAGYFEGRSEYLNMAVQGVQLRRSQFEAAYPPNDGAGTGQAVPEANGLPPTEPAREASATPRGRRPAQYWEACMAAIGGQLYNGDLQPNAQADVEKAMSDWLALRGHYPGTRAVREHARPLWKEVSSG